jgi:hypothetical protein
MNTTLTLVATVLLSGCYTQLQIVEPNRMPVREIVYERGPIDTVPLDEEKTLSGYDDEVIYMRDRNRALFQDREYERGFADGYREAYDDARYDFRRHRWYDSGYDPYFYEPRWIVYYSHGYGWDWGWNWGYPYYGYYGYYPGNYYHPYRGYGHHWVTYNYYYVNPNAETPVARTVNRGRRDSGYQGSAGSTNTGRVTTSGYGVRRSTEPSSDSRTTGTRTTGTQVRRTTGSGSTSGTRTTGSSGTTTRPRRENGTPSSSARPAEQPRRTTETRPERESTRSEAPKSTSEVRPARSSGSTSTSSGSSGNSSSGSSSSSERPKRRN